ncbi:MAG: PAS domain S-box protein [Coleofasciculus sp. S288]|nr:PAS domain S-box protein [Coleofasciculus sp. S288]
MNPLLNKLLSLLAPRRQEYLAIDRNFNILEASFGVQRFADCPNEVKKGKDVRTSFPELIGLEDIFIEISEGRQRSFELKGIARHSETGSPLYLDLSILNNPDKNILKGNLIIFLEDVTEKMILEQSLVQAANEKSLLLDALAASKDYVDKIISSMADALVVTTASGTIKTVNQAAQDLFGYSEDELIGQPVSMVIPEQDLLHQTSLSQDNPSPLARSQVVCRTKTGKKVYVAFSCSAIQTDIEDVQNFAYVGRDVTEEKLAQQRLAAQYAITRILSESTPLRETPRKILQAICKTLEWDVGELWTAGEYLGASVSESTQLRCVELWVQPGVAIPRFAIATQQTTFTLGAGLPGYVWATRSPHWFVDSVEDANFARKEAAFQDGLHGAFSFPIQSDGEVLGVMTFFSREVQRRDQTLLETMAAIGNQLGQFIKRKQAEQALQESEERYRDLFENATDLIQSCTADGQFIYVNRAWRETLGYSEADVRQLNVFDILHPDCKPDCLELLCRLMSGETIDQITAAFVSKDGKKVSVEGNVNCKFIEGQPVATRAIFRDITKRLETEEALHQQQKQTERLLLNILPEAIAERLKQEIRTIAEDFAEVSVMFADIVGFTQLAASLSAIELVNLLSQIFSTFDRLSEKHALEKIKTIGDAYMVVGGLPMRRTDHAEAIANMALDMQAAIAQFRQEKGKALNIRIGIHTGPVVAGVIGIKKFSYDLWGDTVNIASRMESHGVPGQIQVTAATYERLRENYWFEERGVIQVKGKGEMTTYFLTGRKEVVGKV